MRFFRVMLFVRHNSSLSLTYTTAQRCLVGKEWISWLNEGVLLLTMASETSLPTNTAIQTNASGWSWDPRPGRAVGKQSELVLPDSLRLAAGLQLHPRKQ